MPSCLVCCSVPTRFHASFARCNQAPFSFRAESPLLAQAPGADELLHFSVPATFMNSLATSWSETGSEIICFIPRRGDFPHVAVNTINLQQFHLRKHFLQKAWGYCWPPRAAQKGRVCICRHQQCSQNRPWSLEGVSHCRATAALPVMSVSKDWRAGLPAEAACLLGKTSRQV